MTAPRIRRFPELDDPQAKRVLRAALQHLVHLAEQFGWSTTIQAQTARGLRLVLTDLGPGQRVRATAVQQLPRSINSKRVLQVLDDLDLLQDDRTPTMSQWIDRRCAELPAQFQHDVHAWLTWLLEGDRRTRPRSANTLYCYLGRVEPTLRSLADTRGSLREVTTADIQAVLNQMTGQRRGNVQVALKSLFTFCAKKRRVFGNPTTPIKGHRKLTGTVVPLDSPTISTATAAATTPVLRLIVALAAVHAARPATMRHLTLDDIDLGNRRITIDGHDRPLGDLTYRALRDYLHERQQRWPHTANRHLLISKISAHGTDPVSVHFIKQDLHVRHGIRLDDIRADRVLEEALTRGPDPLHLTAVFGINRFTAMRYADLAKQLLQDAPARTAPNSRPVEPR